MLLPKFKGISNQLVEWDWVWIHKSFYSAEIFTTIHWKNKAGKPYGMIRVFVSAPRSLARRLSFPVAKGIWKRLYAESERWKNASGVRYLSWVSVSHRADGGRKIEAVISASDTFFAPQNTFFSMETHGRHAQHLPQHRHNMQAYVCPMDDIFGLIHTCKQRLEEDQLRTQDFW